MKNNSILTLIRVSELLPAIAANHGFDQEIRSGVRTLIKGSKSEGLLACAKRAKCVRHTCLNSMLNQPDPMYPFLATRKGGPRVVLGLRKYSKTSEGRRAVLTVLDLYRVLIAPGEPDTTSITAPVFELPQELLDLVVEKVKPLPQLSVPKYQLRAKSGPNGQCIRTAHLDAIALKASPLLDSAVKALLDHSSIATDLAQVQAVATKVKGEPVHSRLERKFEGGGKVRLFAIVDYYSQLALRPLHNAVGSLLRKIRQDFTGNQGRISEQVQIWRDQGITTFFSIDLKSATDYFPAILQKRVVEKLVSKKFSELGYDVMTSREFGLGSKGPFKYSVGQPMGAYSSGPVFAFSHHLIVRLAARLEKIRSPKYAIVGDDIVIADRKLALRYKDILQKLSVPISLHKSLTGNCLEFCKRIWDDAQEITPIPSQLLVECLTDYRLVIQLDDFLTTRGVDRKLRGRLLFSILSSLSFEKAKRSGVALTAPGDNRITSDDSILVEGLGNCEESQGPLIQDDVLTNIRRAEKLGQLYRATKELHKTYDIVTSDVNEVPGLPADGCDESAISRVYSKLQDSSGDRMDELEEFLNSFDAQSNDPIPNVRVFNPDIIWPDFKSRQIIGFKILQGIHQRAHEGANDDEVVYDNDDLGGNFFHNKVSPGREATASD